MRCNFCAAFLNDSGEDLDYGLLTGCSSSVGSETFTYDQVGNRTDLGGVTGTGNRLQTFNGIQFFHDADGNVIQKYENATENRQYSWSAEARLDSAYHDSWSKVKYDYDALGRPVRKWRGDPNNGWVFDRYWVYDGDQRVLSLDASNARVEEYAYAPGIDRPIATIRGPTGIEAISYHVQDELGNIIGLIENGAYVSQTLSYDAWGTPTETGIGHLAGRSRSVASPSEKRRRSWASTSRRSRTSCAAGSPIFPHVAA